MRVFLHDTPNSGAAPVEHNNFFNKVKSATGYKVGYVVFKSPSAVSKAKSIPFDHRLILSTMENPVLTGMQSKSFIWNGIKKSLE